MHAWTICRSKW